MACGYQAPTGNWKGHLELVLQARNLAVLSVYDGQQVICHPLVLLHLHSTQHRKP